MPDEIVEDRSPCPKCQSTQVQKQGRTRGKHGRQRYLCMSCKARWSDGDDDNRGTVTEVAMTGNAYLDAAAWVLHNVSLKGEALKLAKKKATGLQLTLLEQVNDDPAFKRTFFSTMVPRLFLNEKKMEEEMNNKRETKILVDQIDKMLTTALRESNRALKGVG